MKQKISITIDQNLLERIDNRIDHITRNRSHVIETILAKHLAEKTMLILAGGDHRRILTTQGYRHALPVRGEPLILHTVRTLVANGYTTIVIAGERPALTATFDLLGSYPHAHIIYHEERESKGTYDTIRNARDHLPTTTLCVYADIWIEPIRIDALEALHDKNGAGITITVTSGSEKEKGHVEMEGTRITSFHQKEGSGRYLMFSPIFLIEKRLLAHPYASLEEDALPAFITKGIVHGYLSNEKEIHIHSPKDARLI